MEAVIALLAIVPANVLGHVNGGTAAALCGAIALSAIVLSGYVGKRPWALYAGSVLQLAVIASGVIVSVMYILGVIFTALWFTGIWLARRHEAPRAAAQEPASGPPNVTAPGSRAS